MELVVEAIASFGGCYFGKSGGVNGPDRPAVVADVAFPLRWRIAVRGGRAGRGCGVAVRALGPGLQVKPVREADLGGRRRDRAGPLRPKDRGESC